MNQKLAFLILAMCYGMALPGQNYYRISGEFSIKGRSDNEAQLVMGKFYFDKNEKIIVHDNHFPEKETWVTSDTSLYKIVEGKMVSRQTIPDLTEFSIYNMVLNNRLDNFGLDETVFSLEHIETDANMVITTWIPPKELKEGTGKIMISTVDKNMFGIIFFNPEDQIVKKQFFEDYLIVGGLAFPGKIVEITFKDGTETYQVTNYKNIVLNDPDHEEMYRFDPDEY